MSRLFLALAVSGAVSLTGWAITEFVASRATTFQGRDRWDALVIGLPFVLVVILVAPVIAGAIAGLVSGTPTAALGSVVGYLGGTFATSRFEGDPIPPLTTYVLPIAVFGVLVLAGHMTGVAVRPRLRPA